MKTGRYGGLSPQKNRLRPTTLKPYWVNAAMVICNKSHWIFYILHPYSSEPAYSVGRLFYDFIFKIGVLLCHRSLKNNRIFILIYLTGCWLQYLQKHSGLAYVKGDYSQSYSHLLFYSVLLLTVILVGFHLLVGYP